jgi:hypothetical protein
MYTFYNCYFYVCSVFNTNEILECDLEPCECAAICTEGHTHSFTLEHVCKGPYAAGRMGHVYRGEPEG